MKPKKKPQPIAAPAAAATSGMFTRTMWRSVETPGESIDEEKRTIEFSFSSETPIQDWPGMLLILDHKPECVRLERLQNMGSLLVDHNRSDVVAAIEQAFIGTDRRGRAVARFGRSARAEEVFRDVADGIRRGISVNFQVHHAVLEEETDTQETYRATDWEPLEVSLVSVPADPSVGVGRSDALQPVARPAAHQSQHINRTKEVHTMNFCPICGKQLVDNICPDGHDISAAPARSAAPPPLPPAPAVPPIKVADIERQVTERVATILALGEQHKCAELARAAIAANKSVDEFRTEILTTVYKAKPIDTPDAAIGMSRADLKNWSLVRAIRAAADNDWSSAGLEREASLAVAKIMGRPPQGFFIPFDIMRAPFDESRQLGRRDLQKVNWAAGGAIVATELLSASFIELLRAKTLVKQLGATVFSGLVGDIAIPRQTAAATAYWVAEGVAPTESQQTLGQVGLTPKTCGAFTDASRKLLNQGSIDVEVFMRNDLATILSIAQDLAAIIGTGVFGQPLGILNWPGVGVVAIGANGGAITQAAVVGLETTVMTANADIGSMAYLTCPALYGTMKVTPKTGAILDPIYDTRTPDRPLNGYPCAVSTQVPANLQKGTGTNLRALIFGVWSSLIIAEWGTIDILVDPYSQSSSGNVRVRALMDTDINTRYQQAFAVVRDAT